MYLDAFNETTSTNAKYEMENTVQENLHGTVSEINGNTEFMITFENLKYWLN